jgi:hypothetical protein
MLPTLFAAMQKSACRRLRESHTLHLLNQCRPTPGDQTLAKPFTHMRGNDAAPTATLRGVRLVAAFRVAALD